MLAPVVNTNCPSHLETQRFYLIHLNGGARFIWYSWILGQGCGIQTNAVAGISVEGCCSRTISGLKLSQSRSTYPGERLCPWGIGALDVAVLIINAHIHCGPHPLLTHSITTSFTLHSLNIKIEELQLKLPYRSLWGQISSWTVERNK